MLDLASGQTRCRTVASERRPQQKASGRLWEREPRTMKLMSALIQLQRHSGRDQISAPMQKQTRCEPTPFHQTAVAVVSHTATRLLFTES